MKGKERKRTASPHIADSIVSGAVVLYATYLIQNQGLSKGLLCILFLLMAAENALRPAEHRFGRIQRFCAMGLYLAGAGLIMALDPFHASLLAAIAIELLALLLGRVIAILKKPKKRVIFFNAVCILLVVFAAISIYGSDAIMTQTYQMSEEELMSNPEYLQIADSMDNLESIANPISDYDMLDLVMFVLLMALVLMRMIVHVVGLSVSQMKLKILMNIIRETYVLEILLGFLLMIIAFSSLFLTVEEGITSYGDALWYSFALVTTIGFGDVTASSMLGRVFSVFLGIYGIVMVAVITSVIVNFYGEMRRISEKKPEKDDEEPEEEDEEPEPEV